MIGVKAMARCNLQLHDLVMPVCVLIGISYMYTFIAKENLLQKNYEDVL